MKPYVASHLKDMNRKSVYNLIRNMENTSKAEISKLTGISAPTVIKIVNFLIEKNLIIELGTGDTAIGRKPHLLTLNCELMYVASFVLEGEFLNAGIVDIKGKVIFKFNQKIKKGITGCLKEIKENLVEQLFEEAEIPLHKLCGIGIALPGIYESETMTISSPLILQEEKISIIEEIDEIVEKFQVQVVIENDANSQALGEFENLGLGNNEDLIYISLGTGLGAGLILNGELRHGAKNMCGEIGYITFDETYQTDIKRWGWLEANIGYHKLEEMYGISQYEDGLEEVLEYVGALLARCINNIVAVLDCTSISLGGKIIEILGQEIIHKVNEYLRHLCISDVEVRMESSVDVGLIGIASLVMKEKIDQLLMEE